MESQVAKSDLPHFLSAKFRDSFAYATVRERLPVILSRVADTVYRLKNKIRDEDGQESADELKEIAGQVSRLRHQIQTDKPVELLHGTRCDIPTWNQSLKELLKESEGQPIKWFSSSWLYVECYMYRRIQEAVELTKNLKTLDVFEGQKQNAYLTASGPTTTLLTFLLEVSQKMKEYTPNKKKELFEQFLQIALWGNKCDLSVSAGVENTQKDCILMQLQHLNPNILVDNTNSVYQALEQRNQTQTGPGRVDIVLDNAGFELVTDLCLAELIISADLASTVHIHAKAMPWFVSDVTSKDLDWTLQMMCGTNNLAISTFGAKWQKLIQSGSWVVHDDDFWTTPYSFCVMKQHACALYDDLAKSDLVIFKGDLNFRKLVGDREWDHTTSFSTALCGFEPAPLCSLRVLKSDVMTGLTASQVKSMPQEDKEWMINGNWALVSFHTPSK